LYKILYKPSQIGKTFLSIIYPFLLSLIRQQAMKKFLNY